MTEQEAAIQQVRETLIKAGIDHAVRLRELRSQDRDYDIAVSTSGGLAIIMDDTKRYRFGAVFSTHVVPASQTLVNRWNRQEPNHPVERKSIQRALEAECCRCLLLIHEIQQNIERQERAS